MAPEEQLSEVRLQVGLLNKDVQHTNLLCDKLSESIEKIQEMNMNLVKMLALHDNKHEQHEKVEDGLRNDYKELHSRITTINREIYDRIDQVEYHITSRIDALRIELMDHKTQDKNKLSERIFDIEKWKWMVAGAIALGVWLLGRLDIIGNLFK